MSNYASEVQASVASGEADTDWWNRAHRTDHAMWLTGSLPEDAWRRLAVADYLLPKVKVLNIGIGLGYCTRALHARGCQVSVLDISEVALQRVANIAPGYLASNLDALPTGEFNLALSHLVAQHMYDNDLEAQMKAVIRSLKPGGFFALHYAAPADGSPANINTPEYARGGGVLRESEFIAAMAVRSNARILQDEAGERYPGCVFRTAWIAAAAAGA